jgi:hypothetical protein
VVAQTIRKMLAREPVQRAPSMAWVLEQVARWPRSGEAASLASSGVPAPAARDDHERTADHRTLPAERTQRDDASHPARAGRAATPVAESDNELDPATTTQAMRTLAPLRGRARARTALLLTAGVLAAGALVALLGVAWSGSAAPTHSRPAVPVPATGSTTDRAVAPPRAPEADTHASSATAAGVTAPAVVVEGAAAEPRDTSPDAHPSARSVIDGRPSKSQEPAAVPRRSGAKPPDKKPPARKQPPVKKPPPGDPKDVLIVDPFSHGTSSPRSASP